LRQLELLELILDAGGASGNESGRKNTGARGNQSSRKNAACGNEI
jgi:hypothetical protein